MKTFQPKKEKLQRSWHLFDAKDDSLGRLSSSIATKLMGKHKRTYSRHLDVGDYVVVTNAKKVVLTGKKDQQKVYRSHSGYPGGYKEVKVSKLKSQQPEKIIERAVRGMLPKNRLQKKRMGRLKVFANDKHPYKDKLENGKKD